MKEKVVTLDDILDGETSYRDYLTGGRDSNIEEVTEMYRFIMNVMRYELSERQQECLRLFLVDGLRQKDIADQLGLNASTVCRHIAAAKRKLLHISSYYTDRHRY